MAGIYVHVPFCKSRCAYCDFFSTTREEAVGRYVAAVCCELAARRGELSRARVRTIYIGGGTPSLLTAGQLQAILDTIRAHYRVDEEAEVTVEMNPEDIGQWMVDGGWWMMSGKVNRVSLGIQTFDDGLLRLVRRRHTAQTAVCAVRRLQAAGIGNISIDLIYGLPGQTAAMWERDLDTAFSLGVQHLSAYALSYEEGTLLSRWQAEGRVREAEDELSVWMYERLCERARQEGFEHYEISNFALPGYASRHNSSYWTGEAYLGAGPGAHSYDGERTRRANCPQLDTYLCYWEGHPGDAAPPVDAEVLTDAELQDEAVMCGLRTSAGLNLSGVGERFGPAARQRLLLAAAPHLRGGRLTLDGDRLRLTPRALMISDDVMSDLMV